MADPVIAKAGSMTLTFGDESLTLEYTDGDFTFGPEPFPGLRGVQNREACRTWYQDEPVEECLGCHKPTRNHVGVFANPLCPACQRQARAESIVEVDP